MSTSKSSFLKWSAPVMAAKRKIDCEETLKKLKKSMVEKCGDLRDVLDCIRAPKRWKENGVIWQQNVSDEPSTRHELIALMEALDEALAQSQARETGICEIREAIYSDIFDELIRQTSINCVERGLLLLRIRNEAKDSIRAFKAMYLSGLAYGIRKTLDTDEAVIVLKEEASKLEEETNVLEEELKNIMHTIAEREKELAEKMDNMASKQQAEIQNQEEIKNKLKYLLLSIASTDKNKT